MHLSVYIDIIIDVWRLDAEVCFGLSDSGGCGWMCRMDLDGLLYVR